MNRATKPATVKQLRVCQAHFSDSDYVHTQPGQRTCILKSTAVPKPMVTETTSSPVMEKVGFQRGLDRLLQSGLGVAVVTTHCCPSIKKTMRESYPEIKHQFDPWHVAKGTARYTVFHSRQSNQWVARKSTSQEFRKDFGASCDSTET